MLNSDLSTALHIQRTDGVGLGVLKAVNATFCECTLKSVTLNMVL